MDLVGFIQTKPFVIRTKLLDKKGRPISVRRIRKIEFIGEKPVCDISTTNESFVGDGILCHNRHAVRWTQPLNVGIRCYNKSSAGSKR
jgi:hypothetical protein